MSEKMQIIEMPEPGTDGMVTMLAGALQEALDQLRDMFPFTHGDVMSACMHIIVEAGLKGEPSPMQLQADIVRAAAQIIADNVGPTQ